jgi:hypothetical protein
MSLRAEVRLESEPDVIAKNLRELKNQFPDLKDPDPLVFTELLPVLCIRIPWSSCNRRRNWANVRIRSVAFLPVAVP